MSSPGRRSYLKREDLPRVRNGFGIAIISTSRGLLTDQKARHANVGGEYLCSIW
jgi:small subunit ribosomal protein S8